MGIFKRRDSPFWWMWIEGTKIRRSTGVPFRSSTATHERELKGEAEQIYATQKAEEARKAQLRREGYLSDKPIINFTAYADWYEKHVIAHDRGADKETSMLNRLRIYFGRFESIADIDVDTVKEWMTWRKKQVAPSTVNRELDLLKSLMRSASPRYIAVSPVAGLRRFRTDETEARVLTHDEEDKLLAICGPADLAFVVTAIDTLFRLSNVVNLKWPQVYMDRRFVVPLNAKVTHEGNPITDRMHAALRKMFHDASGWVFPQFHKDGEKKSAAKNKAIRRFLYLCQCANIPHSRAANGVTFHCLRHTGATRALQNGASVRTVMKLGGWKDERSVMRYVHAADADVRQAAESIGRRPTKTGA